MKSRYKILITSFVIIISIFVLDTFVIEPNMIEINEIEISDTGTDMKIGFIADFQRYNSDSSFVQRVVDILNDEDLDLVLIAGDFIDRNPSELSSIEPLKKLETKHGVYGVLGNHDYNVYFFQRNNANLEMAEKVKNYVESDDTVKILKNENIRIENITIIGLDSYWAGLRDEDKALANRMNQASRCILPSQLGCSVS